MIAFCTGHSLQIPDELREYELCRIFGISPSEIAKMPADELFRMEAVRDGLVTSRSRNIDRLLKQNKNADPQGIIVALLRMILLEI